MRNLIGIILLFFNTSMSIYGQNGRTTSRGGDCIFSNQNTFINNIAASIDSNGWIEFKPLGIFQPGELFSTYRSELGLSNDYTMQLISTSTRSHDNLHYRYKQFYKGIPVECGTIIEHFKKCLLTSLNGKILCDLNIDITGTISPSAAINNALNDINATQYQWQDPVAEAELKEDSNNPNATYYPNPKLIIDCSKNLIFKFTINSSIPASITTYHINAKTGQILDKYSPVQNCFHGSDEVCEHKVDEKKKELKYNTKPIFKLPFLTDFVTLGPTSFEGLQSIRTTWSSSKHRLIANNYSSKIETRDNQGATNRGEWKRKVTMDGIGSTTWPLAESRHTQTHWAAMRAWDYYSDVHGKSVGAGSGTIKVKSNCGYFGAFYLGDNRSIEFGLGFSGEYLGSMDIVGHEFTHLMNHAQNGIGSTGVLISQSLNESFSDILGTMVERQYRPSGGDWIIGDETTVRRDLLNPRFSGRPQPETIGDVNWNGPGQPHTNGGVQNKWFSLLSVGGVHNGISVQGIGTNKAEQIVMHNLENYIVEESNYTDTRNGSVNSAEDLYGRCSFEHLQTQLAWQACGVGAVRTCFTNLETPIICRNESNLPICITVGGNLTSPLVWNPVTFTFLGITRTTADWTVNVSGPNNNKLCVTNIPNNSAIGGLYWFTYIDQSGATGIIDIWIQDCPPGFSPPNPPNNNYCNLLFQTILIPRESGGDVVLIKDGLKISPNPSDYIINIEYPLEAGEAKYELFDISGKVVLQGKCSGNQIDISPINKGLYICKISTLSKKYYGKFIKEN